MSAVAKAAWVLWKDDPERVGDLVRKWTPESDILAEDGQKMLALGTEQGYLTPGWAFQRIERWLRGGDVRDREAALKAAARLFDREPENTIKVLKQWADKREKVFDLFVADLCATYVGTVEAVGLDSRAALKTQLERMESVVNTLKETHQSFLEAKQTAGHVMDDARGEGRADGRLTWLENAPDPSPGREKLNHEDKDRQHFWEGARVKKGGGRGGRRRRR